LIYSKLNLGCGLSILSDYVNVDLELGEGVDLVADINSLHFAESSIDEILIQDTLEHLSLNDATTILRRCLNWLNAGGALTVTVPNLTVVAYYLSVGTHHEMLKLIYGSDGSNHPPPQAFHRWAYSEESLTSLLEDLGYSVTRTALDCNKMRLWVTAKRMEN